MILFIVMGSWDYECDECLGVFSSRALANDAITISTSNKFGFDRYTVIETNLDSVITPT